MNALEMTFMEKKGVSLTVWNTTLRKKLNLANNFKQLTVEGFRDLST